MVKIPWNLLRQAAENLWRKLQEFDDKSLYRWPEIWLAKRLHVLIATIFILVFALAIGCASGSDIRNLREIGPAEYFICALVGVTSVFWAWFYVRMACTLSPNRLTYGWFGIPVDSLTLILVSLAPALTIVGYIGTIRSQCQSKEIELPIVRYYLFCKVFSQTVKEPTPALDYLPEFTSLFGQKTQYLSRGVEEFAFRVIKTSNEDWGLLRKKIAALEADRTLYEGKEEGTPAYNALVPTSLGLQGSFKEESRNVLSRWIGVSIPSDLHGINANQRTLIVKGFNSILLQLGHHVISETELADLPPEENAELGNKLEAIEKNIFMILRYGYGYQHYFSSMKSLFAESATDMLFGIMLAVQLAFLLHGFIALPASKMLWASGASALIVAMLIYFEDEIPFTATVLGSIIVVVFAIVMLLSPSNTPWLQWLGAFAIVNTPWTLGGMIGYTMGERYDDEIVDVLPAAAVAIIFGVILKMALNKIVILPMKS